MFEHYEPNQATEPKPESKPSQATPSSKRRGVFKIKNRGTGKTVEGDSGKTIDGKTWQQSIKPWVTLLWVLLLLSALLVCLWNIAPYEVAVRTIASRFEGSALVGFLLGVPLLGWLLTAIGAFIFWIIAVIVWATIQTIELMPMFMTNHPGYVRSVLTAYESSPKFKEKGGDPGIVKTLKGFYNRLPLRFLIISRRLRGWIYLVDMLIVMAVYPPAENLPRFFFLLATGQWGRLDWGNIFLAFVTLFAVEAVVKLLLVTSHFRKYLKASADKAQSKAVTA